MTETKLSIPHVFSLAGFGLDHKEDYLNEVVNYSSSASLSFACRIEDSEPWYAHYIRGVCENYSLSSIPNRQQLADLLLSDDRLLPHEVYPLVLGGFQVVRCFPSGDISSCAVFLNHEKLLPIRKSLFIYPLDYPPRRDFVFANRHVARKMTEDIIAAFESQDWFAFCKHVNLLNQQVITQGRFQGVSQIIAKLRVYKAAACIYHPHSSAVIGFVEELHKPSFLDWLVAEDILHKVAWADIDFDGLSLKVSGYYSVLRGRKI